MSKQGLPGMDAKIAGFDPEDAKTPASQMITMDAATLDTLLQSRVNEAIAKAQLGATVPSVDNFEKAMAHLRGQDQPAQDVRRFACVSPLTGATFVAVVHFNARNPRGRCLYLENYAEPLGVWKNVSNGGLYPDGQSIFSAVNGEVLGADGRVTLAQRQVRTQDHKWWMWREYFHKDLSEFAGKPFQTYITVEATEARAAADASFAPKPIDKVV